MWLLLNNKSLTWDLLQKRNIVGLGWCCLCKQEEETNLHLIMSFPYAKKVWNEVEGLTNLKNVWDGNSIEEALKI
jgi:hypothetical protein